VIRIGHRGAAGHAPENTLVSVNRAIVLGVELVEVDVQRSRDGELVILHDKRVDRTTDGTGYVKDMDFVDIRSLNAGQGELVPLAQEVLGACRGRAEVLMEIIDPLAAPAVLRLLENTASVESTIVSSFHHACLLELRTLKPSLRTLALIEGIPVEQAGFALSARVNYVGASLESLSEDFVYHLHQHGLKLFAYTANDPRDIAWLTRIGVDGIISDYPERIP
jgi:glycerophosphoryl diester phosphodiesterase